MKKIQTLIDNKNKNNLREKHLIMKRENQNIVSMEINKNSQKFQLQMMMMKKRNMIHLNLNLKNQK